MVNHRQRIIKLGGEQLVRAALRAAPRVEKRSPAHVFIVVLRRLSAFARCAHTSQPTTELQGLEELGRGGKSRTGLITPIGRALELTGP